MAGLLVGCSPTFDWRELASQEGRFKVLMPAKPSEGSGSDGAGNPQSMWTAQAEGSLFSVGYTDYRDVAQGHVDAVRDLLLRSARGKLIRQAATQPPQPEGLGFTVQGLAPDGSDRLLQVWLFPRGARLYQLAVASRPGKLQPEQIDMFLGSIKLD